MSLAATGTLDARNLNASRSNRIGVILERRKTHCVVALAQRFRSTNRRNRASTLHPDVIAGFVAAEWFGRMLECRLCMNDRAALLEYIPSDASIIKGEAEQQVGPVIVSFTRD